MIGLQKMDGRPRAAWVKEREVRGAQPESNGLLGMSTGETLGNR